MKKHSTLLPVLCAVFVTALLCVTVTAAVCMGPLSAQKEPQQTQDTVSTEEVADDYFDIERLEAVIEMYEDKSAFTLDTDGLTEALIDAFIDFTADEYASYMTAEEYEEYFSSYSAVATGIGIRVASVSGRIVIMEVVGGSPAEQAGLLAGDVILGADGVLLDGNNSENLLEDAQELFAKEEGSVIELSVDRSGKSLNVQVEVREYSVRTVSLEYISYCGKRFAVIAINSFDYAAPVQFKEAVDEAEKNADFIVFDLRGNLGGLLSSVSAMLTYLVGDGVKLAEIVYRNSSDEIYSGENANDYYFTDNSVGRIEVTLNGAVIYNSAYAQHKMSIPAAVLTDGRTASAAELFTAVLRDYDLATIVGQNTYGKGCMQATYKLDDGGELKLTTAYYNPPCGVNYDVSTDGPVGIAPDIKAEDDATADTGIEGYEKDAVILAALEALSGTEQ